MNWGDVRAIVALADHKIAHRWYQTEFLEAFTANETIGFVCEVKHDLVGVALCTITRIGVGPGMSLRSLPQWLWAKFTTARCHRRWFINLVEMAVNRDWPTSEIEWHLIRMLERRLRRPHDRIQCVVPESSVGVQVALRSAGFRAVRVIPNYCNGETGYAMIRENVSLHAGQSPRATEDRSCSSA